MIFNTVTSFYVVTNNMHRENVVIIKVDVKFSMEIFVLRSPELKQYIVLKNLFLHVA